MSYPHYPVAAEGASPAAAAPATAAAAPAGSPYAAPAWGAVAAVPPPWGAMPAWGAPPAYGYGYPPYSDPNEMRTIFLTGFPPDLKERELNNLLRFLPGYEASQLHPAGVKSAQAQGFALFDCGASAQNALHRIARLVFDEGSILRCEMARKNMFLKDASTKRSRYDTGPPAAYPGYGSPATPYYGGGYGGGQAAGYQAVSNTKDNPPCNTLFIGNLGDSTDENELRGLFGAQPGYRQIKLNHGARGLTCFVEFSDLASAMAVHEAQQGAILPSSDRGGIRIQYSRNPFGKKRDYGSFNDQTPTSPSPMAPAPLDATPQAAQAAAAAYEQPPAAQPQEHQPPAAAATAYEQPANGKHVEGGAVPEQPAAAYAGAGGAILLVPLDLLPPPEHAGVSAAEYD